MYIFWAALLTWAQEIVMVNFDSQSHQCLCPADHGSDQLSIDPGPAILVGLAGKVTCIGANKVYKHSTIQFNKAGCNTCVGANKVYKHITIQ